MISAFGNTASPALVADAVDVVAVEVGNDDPVDLLGRVAGGREVGEEATRAWRAHLAIAGIDQDELASRC